MKKRNDILAISSSGGHWVQLLRVRKAWEGHSVCYATVNPALRSDVPHNDFYVIADANRWHKIALIKSLWMVFNLVLKVRPRIIITTGAAPGFFALLCGRLIGARTMWIDSIANVTELSLSGRLAKIVADDWLTQWQELSRPNGPFFHGSVL